MTGQRGAFFEIAPPDAQIQATLITKKIRFQNFKRFTSRL